MEQIHNLLKRQLRKYIPSNFACDEVQPLIDAVNNAYHQSDTDRAMLEHALELSSNELLMASAELQAVLQAFPDLFLILNFDGKILDSRGGEQDDAYISPERLIGRHIHDTPIEISEKEFNRAAGAVRDTRVMTILEYSLTKDNTEKYYEARLLRMSEDALLMVVRNTTKRKLAQIREKELQLKLADAERRSSLGVLAGGVAHDLNNILGPLVLLPEMIDEVLAKPDTASAEDFLEARESLDVIERSARRASETVKDLKVLGDRGPVTVKPMDANKLAQDVLSTHEVNELIRDHPHVTLDHKLYDGKLTVSVNKSDLYRILFNLIQNAMESTPDTGQVQIQTDLVSLSEQAIGYETVEPGDYVVFSVNDTGEGINDDVFHRVFEPFVTTKRISGGKSGSGLGLSVVHSIVKSLHGFMDITREAEGWSTIFSIYLPAEVRDCETEKHETSEKQLFRKPKDALVVDDEPYQRFAAKRALTRYGYAVSEASNGHECVEVVKKTQTQGKKFSLIIVDMSMEEGFDGLDTYKTLLKVNPSQKVIIASGHAKTDRIRAAAKLGAGWLPKPYTYEAIEKELIRMG